MDSMDELTPKQLTRIIKLIDGGALADYEDDGTVHIDSVFNWAHFTKLLNYVDALPFIDDIDFGVSQFRPWAHTAHRWYTADGGSITQHDDDTISVLWLTPPYPPRKRVFHDWDDMRAARELFPLIEYKETTDDA